LEQLRNRNVQDAERAAHQGQAIRLMLGTKTESISTICRTMYVLFTVPVFLPPPKKYIDYIYTIYLGSHNHITHIE